MSSYDTAMAKYDCLIRGKGNKDKTLSLNDLDDLSSTTIAESKKGVLLSGEVAAYLTSAGMLCPDISTQREEFVTKNKSHSPDLNKDTRTDMEYKDVVTDPPMFMMHCLKDLGPNKIQLPVLTEEEKSSPVGACMCYLMAKFLAMEELILNGRKKERRMEPSSSEQNKSIHTKEDEMTSEHNKIPLDQLERSLAHTNSQDWRREPSPLHEDYCEPKLFEPTRHNIPEALQVPKPLEPTVHNPPEASKEYIQLYSTLRHVNSFESFKSYEPIPYNSPEASQHPPPSSLALYYDCMMNQNRFRGHERDHNGNKQGGDHRDFDQIRCRQEFNPEDPYYAFRCPPIPNMRRMYHIQYDNERKRTADREQKASAPRKMPRRVT